jgi:hypothetical protein
MATPRTKARRNFGQSKYAAFHLLLARWLYHYAGKDSFHYVSFGGTELRDAQSIYYIGLPLKSKPISFEFIPERFTLAEQRAQALREKGITIELCDQEFFRSFVRRDDRSRHIFFLDFEGVCAFSDYKKQFAAMFRDELIRENDCLFITSFLARASWKKVFDTFDGEFRVLGITSAEHKRIAYKRSHPGFTLYRSLQSVDLHDEIKIECFGCIEYFDTSSMAVYGYHIRPGVTRLDELASQAHPFLHSATGYL